MRAVLSFLVVAAAVIAFFWWLLGLPGTIGGHIGDTTIDMPTYVALMALGVLFLLLYAGARLLAMLAGLPRRTSRMQALRNRRRGETALTRTLLALAGGDGEAALREAERSRALLGDTPQTLLLAAYAGRQAGQEEEATAAFRTLAAREDAGFLGLRGLLQQAVARGDWDEADRLARQAEAANPGGTWLQAERKQLAIRNGAWRNVLELAGPDDPKAAFGTAAALAETDTSEGRRLAKKAWAADEGFTPAALAYAGRLRDAGKENRAQDVLRTAWSRAPHPDLAEAMLATAPDDLTRTRRAEALAASMPTHVESQLLLTRVALSVNLPGEAQRHADEALAAGVNQRRLWLLFADIAGRNGDGAAQADALRRAAAADPDPAWRCGACGATHQAWAPRCDECGTPGLLNWGVAPSRARSRMLVADGGSAILP